jgi:hypothetical protein
MGREKRVAVSTLNFSTWVMLAPACELSDDPKSSKNFYIDKDVREAGGSSESLSIENLIGGRRHKLLIFALIRLQRHFLGTLLLELLEMIVILFGANIETVADIGIGEPVRRPAVTGEVAHLERCHVAKPLGAGRRIGWYNAKTCSRKQGL